MLFAKFTRPSTRKKSVAARQHVGSTPSASPFLVIRQTSCFALNELNKHFVHATYNSNYRQWQRSLRLIVTRRICYRTRVHTVTTNRTRSIAYCLSLVTKLRNLSNQRTQLSIISIVTFAFPGYCSGIPTGFFFQSYVYD